jgi:hypothetical protein
LEYSAQLGAEESLAHPALRTQNANGCSWGYNEIQVLLWGPSPDVSALPSACFLKDRPGGIFIPQIPIWQDDVIFAKEKRRVFQIAVLAASVTEVTIRAENLHWPISIICPVGLFSADEVPYLIHSKKPQKTALLRNYVFAMSKAKYDEMGFRPPEGYDKDRIKNVRGGSS